MGSAHAIPSLPPLKATKKSPSTTIKRNKRQRKLQNLPSSIHYDKSWNVQGLNSWKRTCLGQKIDSTTQPRHCFLQKLKYLKLTLPLSNMFGVMLLLVGRCLMQLSPRVVFLFYADLPNTWFMKVLMISILYLPIFELADGFSFWCYSVYGPSGFGMNFMMWPVWEEKTGLLVGTSKCYLLVLGKISYQSISTSTCEFNHWINNYQLRGISLNNGSFTWSSGGRTQYSSLIDCFLLKDTCIAKLGTVKVQ